MSAFDELVLVVNAQGERQTVTALKNVDAAMTGLATNAKRAAGPMGVLGRVQGAVSKESKNAGREMGMLVNTIGEMAFSFSTAIPPLRTLGTQFAMAGGSAFTLGSAFGPIGAGVGALIGTLPALIGLISDTGDEMARASVEAMTLAEAIERAKQAQEQRAQAARIREGEGTLIEQQEALRLAEQLLDRLRDTREEIRRESRVTEETMERLAAYDRQIELQEAEVERLQNALQRRRLIGGDLEQTGESVLRETRRRAEEAVRQMREEEERAAGRSGRGGRGGRGERQRTLEDLMAQAERASGPGGVGSLGESLTAEFGRQEGFDPADVVVSLLPNEDEARDNAEALIAAIRDVQGAIDDSTRSTEAWAETMEMAGGIAKQALLGGVEAAMEGNARALDIWLEGFAKQQALKALGELAEAAGSYPDFVGIEQHLQAAALHGVAAAAAGGAAMAIPNDVGAGGGGGGADRPRGPDVSAGGSGGKVENIQITTIINDPVDEARAGIIQQRYTRAARATYSGRA